MPLASCLVASGFLPIIRQQPILFLVMISPLPSLVGAGISASLVAFPMFLIGAARSGGLNPLSFIVVPFIGMWAATIGWTISVPMGVAYVLALRYVVRFLLSREAAPGSRVQRSAQSQA
jgi:hypothetical protein